MENCNPKILNTLRRKRLIPVYITSMVFMLGTSCSTDDELPLEVNQENQVATIDDLEIIANNFNKILSANEDETTVDTSFIELVKEIDTNKKQKSISKNSSQSNIDLKKLTIENEPKIIDLTFELAKEIGMIDGDMRKGHDSELPAYFDSWNNTSFFHEIFNDYYVPSVRGHKPNRLKSYHFSGKKSDGSVYRVAKVINNEVNYKGNNPEKYLTDPIRLKAYPIYDANKNKIELKSKSLGKEIFGNKVTIPNESENPVFVNDINNLKELIAISHSKVKGKTTTISNSIGSSIGLGFKVGFNTGGTGLSANGEYSFNATFTNETSSSTANTISDTETKSQPIPYGHIKMPANCNCTFVPVAEKREYDYKQAYRLEYESGNMSYTYLSKDFLINSRDQYTTQKLSNITPKIVNEMLKWSTQLLDHNDPQRRRGHFADKYIFNAYSTYSVGYECKSRVNDQLIKRENYPGRDNVSREIFVGGESETGNSIIKKFKNLKSFRYFNELKVNISYTRNRNSKIYFYLQDNKGRSVYVPIQGDGSNNKILKFNQNDFILINEGVGFDFHKIKYLSVFTPSANSKFNYEVTSL